LSGPTKPKEKNTTDDQRDEESKSKEVKGERERAKEGKKREEKGEKDQYIFL